MVAVTTLTTAIQAAHINSTNVERTSNALSSFIETLQTNPFGALCLVLICIAFATIYWKKGPDLWRRRGCYDCNPGALSYMFTIDRL